MYQNLFYSFFFFFAFGFSVQVFDWRIRHQKGLLCVISKMWERERERGYEIHHSISDCKFWSVIHIPKKKRSGPKPEFSFIAKNLSILWIHKKDLEILFPIFYIKELIKQILGIKPVAKTITNNYDQENINTKSEDWQLNCATLHIQQNWSGTNEKLGEQNKFMMDVYTIFH